MKKWILLFLGIFLFLVVTANIAAADEHLYGKWRYEKPEGSSVLVFIFLAGEKGEMSVSYNDDGLGQKQFTLPFSYVVESKIVASSSIDEFREYILQMNFTGRAAAKIRILFGKDGTIQISGDKGGKLIFTKMGDEQDC